MRLASRRGVMDNLHRMAGALRSVRLQSVVAAIACWTLTLACAGPSQAQGWQGALKPQGVYAHVDLHFLINEYYKHQGGTGEALCPPQAPTGRPNFITDLHNHLKSIYQSLLIK